MQIKVKKKIANALVILIAVATLIGIALVTDVYAAADSSAVSMQAGHGTKRHDTVKKPKTGLYKRGGHWYYGHETKSMLYGIGDLTRDSFRIINGKYYYFRYDGRMLEHSTHYLKLGKRDKSGKRHVKYVYMAGTGKKTRFNVKLRRMQYKKHGKWRTEPGMQYDLYGQIDMQP